MALGRASTRRADLGRDLQVRVSLFLIFRAGETDNAYIGRSEARERLVNRHLSEGVESTRAGAIRRGTLLFASGFGTQLK